MKEIDYEILYDLGDGEYSEAGVGGIRTRTWRAGDTLEVCCFPILRLSHDAQRERERRESSAAQEALNLRRARQRVRLLIEGNFDENDYVVHPTYDYSVAETTFQTRAQAIAAMEKAGLPLDEDDARRDMRNYLKRIRRAMRRAGHDPKELKYLYVMESSHEPRDEDPNPLPAHYHFHMVIHAPGLTRDQLEALWGKGYCNTRRLDFRDNGLAALANYITKQRRMNGSGGARRTRRWACSKNLKQPEERVSDRKVSRRRAALVAEDVRQFGREIFERCYPGYRVMEQPEVRMSAFASGAYIYARMRRQT